MHEIKDEPILGNQSLFNGAPEDAVCVIKTNDGNKYFFSENDSKAFGIYLCFAGQLEISMRRVIRTPVWTKADQLAGKLPEVGAEVMCMDDSRHNFVGESIHAGQWALCDGKTKKVFHIPATAVRPVETDTERQQRLKEEWCHSALKLINDELTDACDAAVIYDALVSGELKVPEVRK